jgi:rhamnosyl/mannosyltransferase
MRILHVYKTYLPDSFTGIERVIREIIEGTIPFGVESEVFTLSATPSPSPQLVGRHRVHQARRDFYVASTGLSISGFRTFARLAATVDIVHYHFPWPMMDLLHLYSHHAKPTLVTYHSDIVRQAMLLRLYRPLMLWFLAAADRLVATSPNYLATSPVLQRFRHKTEVIPIGLAPRRLPDRAKVEKWRQRLGDRFFLFVGVLRYYKGIADLLEAARISGLPVVILGDGEMRGIIEHARPPNVTLLGTLDDTDKEALLELSTAFVFPSHLRSEAYGVALAEAARAGKPMITCEIGTGTSYINHDGETGFVVPPNNPARLAGAMHEIWASRELAEGMGKAAAEHFARHLTAAPMAERYARLYAELLEQSLGGTHCPSR